MSWKNISGCNRLSYHYYSKRDGMWTPIYQWKIHSMDIHEEQWKVETMIWLFHKIIDARLLSFK
jgi:hypothetical protein